MRKVITFGALTLAAAIGLPGMAWAQGGGAGQGGQVTGSRQGGDLEMRPQASTYASGLIRGTVAKVNLGKGTISVRSGNDTIVLNANPVQLASLNPGDVLQFPYVNYLGTLWLAPTMGGRGQLPLVFNQQGRVTGTIQNMARAQGGITVRGTTFRIHPAQLQGLLPGEFVSVTYAQVGNTNWVTNIAPAGSGGQGAAGQSGAVPGGQGGIGVGGMQGGYGMQGGGYGMQGGGYGAQGGLGGQQGQGGYGAQGGLGGQQGQGAFGAQGGLGGPQGNIGAQSGFGAQGNVGGQQGNLGAQGGAGGQQGGSIGQQGGGYQQQGAQGGGGQQQGSQDQDQNQ